MKLSQRNELHQVVVLQGHGLPLDYYCLGCAVLRKPEGCGRGGAADWIFHEFDQLQMGFNRYHIMVSTKQVYQPWYILIFF